MTSLSGGFHAEQSCYSAAQHSIVRRVDNGLGLLLELRAEEDAPADQEQAEGEDGGPQLDDKGGSKKKKHQRQQREAAKKARRQAQAGPSAPAGYAHISAVSDRRIEKLDKVEEPSCMSLSVHERIQPVRNVSKRKTSRRGLWRAAKRKCSVHFGRFQVGCSGKYGPGANTLSRSCRVNCCR